MQSYYLDANVNPTLNYWARLSPCRDSWGRERTGDKNDWYKKSDVDPYVAELEAKIAELETKA